MDPITANLNLYLWVTASEPTFFVSLGFTPLFLLFAITAIISLFYLRRKIDKQYHNLPVPRNWKYTRDRRYYGSI